MSDNSHHFSSNVQQAFENGVAGSYFLTAQLYARAASKLRHGHDIPQLTLVLFALELALKAYLLDSGTDEKTLRSGGVQHDLRALHDSAVAKGLSFNNADVVTIVDQYREDHRNHFFRYGLRDYADLKDPD